ncbi:coiled-coil domain-containing protein 91 isoform X2 [Ascaphus truei]
MEARDTETRKVVKNRVSEKEVVQMETLDKEAIERETLQIIKRSSEKLLKRATSATGAPNTVMGDPSKKGVRRETPDIGTLMERMEKPLERAIIQIIKKSSEVLVRWETSATGSRYPIRGDTSEKEDVRRETPDTGDLMERKEKTIEREILQIIKKHSETLLKRQTSDKEIPKMIKSGVSEIGSIEREASATELLNTISSEPPAKEVLRKTPDTGTKKRTEETLGREILQMINKSSEKLIEGETSDKEMAKSGVSEKEVVQEKTSEALKERVEEATEQEILQIIKKSSEQLIWESSDKEIPKMVKSGVSEKEVVQEKTSEALKERVEEATEREILQIIKKSSEQLIGETSDKEIPKMVKSGVSEKEVVQEKTSEALKERVEEAMEREILQIIKKSSEQLIGETSDKQIPKMVKTGVSEKEIVQEKTSEALKERVEEAMELEILQIIQKSSEQLIGEVLDKEIPKMIKEGISEKDLINREASTTEPLKTEQAIIES